MGEDIEKHNGFARVSIVVLDYRGKTYLPELMRSLGRQTFVDFELLLVDNGGVYGEGAIVGEFPIRVLRPGKNLGFAEGCNRGWRCSEGDFVVFLNNDVSLERDWLEQLVCRIVMEPEVGMVCSKVLFDRRQAIVNLECDGLIPSNIGDGPDKRELGIRLLMEDGSVCRFASEGLHGTEVEAGASWAWSEARANVSLRERDDRKVGFLFKSHPVQRGQKLRVNWGREKETLLDIEGGVEQSVELDAEEAGASYLVNNAGSVIREDWHVEERGLYEPDDGRFDEPLELEAASACSMIVRREALEGEMPFDPEFFAYYEDVDLCRKLRKRGWKILYEPKSVVYHKRSGTAGTQSAFQVFHATRNRFWVIAKHAPLGVVWNAVSREMWDLSSYKRYLNEDYSLGRLYRETWWGFVKRFLVRILDLE